jgi:rhodanese-related sulfurtransferase
MFIVGVVMFLFLSGCDSDDAPELSTPEVTASEQTFDSLRAQLNEYAWKTDRLQLFTIIDVRPSKHWLEGSIQDAINIPYDTFLDDKGELIDGGEALTSIVTDTDWEVVVYGDDLDWVKRFVRAAEELGYSQLSYYPAGISEWEEHNEYLVISYEAFSDWYNAHCPFDDGENYLIDVNEIEDYTAVRKAGHIPAATLVDNRTFVSMDGTNTLIDDAKKLTDALPNKDAKIVIYCSDTWCPISEWASEVAVSLGYTNVYRLEGGYVIWAEKGNDLAEGEEPGPCAEAKTAQ